jgi:hypothetical protein
VVQMQERRVHGSRLPPAGGVAHRGGRHREGAGPARPGCG